LGEKKEEKEKNKPRERTEHKNKLNSTVIS
jgi:hypothetical protein